jgi:glyoxylase-like metal-dependent hydrolase (beta-lactamase superfamily II)
VASEAHRYKIGDITVTVLSDGFRVVSTDNYIANAGKDELVATLASAGLPTDHMRNTYAPIVLETSGKRVLIDTGNGEAVFAQSKGERGRLQQNLAAAGIDRKTVDTVVISHFHADHVNGLLDAESKPAFPNAALASEASGQRGHTLKCARRILALNRVRRRAPRSRCRRTNGSSGWTTAR